MAIFVEPTLCPQNHRCPAIQVCPRGAISQDGFGLPVVDEELCNECMKCVRFCPMGALQKRQ